MMEITPLSSIEPDRTPSSSQSRLNKLSQLVLALSDQDPSTKLSFSTAGSSASVIGNTTSDGAEGDDAMFSNMHPSVVISEIVQTLQKDVESLINTPGAEKTADELQGEITQYKAILAMKRTRLQSYLNLPLFQHDHNK